MLWRIPLLAGFALLAPGGLLAQSAEGILKRHVKAAGGAKALRAITSTRYAGTVTRAAQPDAPLGQFVWQFKSPALFYEELRWPAAATAESFNGRSAWRELPDGGLATLTGREPARARAWAVFRNDRLVTWKKQRVRVRLVGSGEADGKPARIVEFTTQTGLQRRLWFDAGSHLLLREESERESGAEVIDYAGYRAVDGVQEPHRIRIRRAGEIFEVAVTHVSHNLALPESIFDFPHRASTPLPQVAGLLEALAHNQKTLEALLENYTYTMVQTEIEVDGKGSVKQKREKTYEVFYLDGRAVQKLVAEDGHPLSPGDARKEDARIEKIIRLHQEHKERRLARRTRPGQAQDGEGRNPTVGDFLHLSQFVHPRRERFRGRNVIVFEFEPRPGYKPRNRSESLLQKLGGVVWIDEDARQVARLEARLLDSFRMGGGLVASVRQGSALVFEQELVRGEVWLPLYAEVNLSARLFLLAGVKMNMILRFSDFKKFNVETRSEIKPPAVPQDFR